jgi:glutamate racemase
VRIALINSGLGLIAAAAALHRKRPDADLVLATDPDGMPWGPRTPDDIVGRALLCARAAAAYRPDVLVMACNTGSVHALEAMRAEFEPDIPVIGTVPAIKPAAAAHRLVAIWATVATTASAYQRRLIAEFGGSALVTPVACPGLADAVDAGDEAAAEAAVIAAAARTPAGCHAVVLGCTEYELAADRIRAAVPGAVTFGSADAVAAQALRRVPADSGQGRSASCGLDGARLNSAHPGNVRPDGARPGGAPDDARPDSPRLDSALPHDGARPDSPRLDSALPRDGARPDSPRLDSALPHDGARPDSPRLDSALPRDGARPDSPRLDSALPHDDARPDSPRLDSRRLDDARPYSPRLGAVRVLLSGRPAPLPAAAFRYPEGRLLAPLVRFGDSDRERAEGSAVTR